MDLLRRQAGFWAAVGACLPDAGQRSAAEAEEGGGRGGDAAWRMAAEASALQLMAVDAFAHQRAPDGEALPSPWSRCMHATSCVTGAHP